MDVCCNVVEISDSIFLERVADWYERTSPENKLVVRAYIAARDGHIDRIRDSGRPYLSHVVGVAHLVHEVGVTDARVLAAALLHDHLEDLAEWTPARMRREFGATVTHYVQYVTKPREIHHVSRYEAVWRYWQQIACAPYEVQVLKLADVLNNVCELWPCSEEKRRRKLREAHTYALPLARRTGVFVDKLVAAMDMVETDLFQ